MRVLPIEVMDQKGELRVVDTWPSDYRAWEQNRGLLGAAGKHDANGNWYIAWHRLRKEGGIQVDFAEFLESYECQPLMDDDNQPVWRTVDPTSTATGDGSSPG